MVAFYIYLVLTQTVLLVSNQKQCFDMFYPKLKGRLLHIPHPFATKKFRSTRMCKAYY